MAYRLKSAPLGSTRTESPMHDLAALIRSRTPLVVVESNEEPQVVKLVRGIGRQLQLKSYRWTISEGLQAFDPCDQPLDSVMRSEEVLAYVKLHSRHSVFVLLDFAPFLRDALHVRLLKDIALTYTTHHSTVVLVGATIELPGELRPFSAVFQLPLPSEDEIRSIIVDEAAQWGAEHDQREVQTTNKALDMLVRSLAGLTTTDVRRLARNAVNDNGVICESDLPQVMRAKYDLLGRDSPLTFEYETAQFAEVGGMRRLRAWLEPRRVFFREGGPANLDPPRGILLLGVQGCGKSLAAKAAAGMFSVPLLRLDFGSLYNKYYGETEKNLRSALATAEVMAPCVLWLDEVEKGVSTRDEDDGLSRRVLGTLLTWMSEKRRAVFVVATANDITRLPPEMVRKGRFDEIFFVDLPTLENRKTIFAIHLRKRGLDTGSFDLEALAGATDGFSGSEIEQAVVSAMYSAYAAGRTLAEEDLFAEAGQTRPLSVVMKEDVDDLRTWARDRTVPCD
jgi:SpoVK/Ycf46/Vps4 family AAA+-type ATPase